MRMQAGSETQCSKCRNKPRSTCLLSPCLRAQRGSLPAASWGPVPTPLQAPVGASPVDRRASARALLFRQDRRNTLVEEPPIPLRHWAARTLPLLVVALVTSWGTLQAMPLLVEASHQAMAPPCRWDDMASDQGQLCHQQHLRHSSTQCHLLCQAHPTCRPSSQSDWAYEVIELQIRHSSPGCPSRPQAMEASQWDAGTTLPG
mmetsp:Transcript_25311/g.55480  ORF Transcript_25311/g.55480 Transcript_25311/m.55480 type:complete len:203 (-) Transcript_25311:205-813(-)